MKVFQIGLMCLSALTAGGAMAENIALTCAYSQDGFVGRQFWLTKDGASYVAEDVTQAYDRWDNYEYLERKVLGRFSHCKQSAEDKNIVVCTGRDSARNPSLSFLSITRLERTQMAVGGSSTQLNNRTNYSIAISSPEVGSRTGSNDREYGSDECWANAERRIAL